MEIKVHNKNKIEIIAEGHNHTLLNILKHELSQEPTVIAASYAVRHPLIPKPVMLVQTKQGTEPKKVVLAALAKLKKNLANFKKSAAKELK